MNKFKSHFRFDKQERNGIFFLLLTIVLLQTVYFLVKYQNSNTDSALRWDSDFQKGIDSLKQIALVTKTPKIYPFNPNYITDFKGYTLGMSTEEIDRLIAFRKTGKFVNSNLEFQVVTQVSDSLLSVISPFFKFPEWTQKRNKTQISATTQNKTQSVPINKVKDINKASAEQLMEIYGVGEKLSARIIKFRDRLGGFLVNDQLYDVYGLDTETVERALQRFQVVNPPKIKKIKINSASSSEIAGLIYINRSQAEKIVRYREVNGPFNSLNDVAPMFNDSKEKIDRIGLYLSFEKE
ncbi:MAG: helix-hairpin-helix domain-containing protein [Bacteroidota bacterium]